MSTSTDIPLTSIADALGVLAFRGADAARFLQGQLSADIEKLAAGASTLAGLHNPQGRIVALLGVVRTSSQECLATLPLELVEPVAQRLRKYVLRAKVRVDIPGAALRVRRSHGDEPADVARIAWADRGLLLVPAGHALFDAPESAPAAWRLADVRAGLPQVYASTSEQFVAQMLNLDLLGGIAFDKGCYTGQEVIARAHYRGRVKRRMQRWLNLSGTALEPGDAARAPDGRSLAVVRVGPCEAGGQELLAVGNYVAGPDDVGPATATRSDATHADAANVDAGNGGASIMVGGPLPLPYALPE